MDDRYGVLLHRDMWRREGDGVWPLRNVASSREDADTTRLRAGPVDLYAQNAWRLEILRFVTLRSASGQRHNGYLCRLMRGAA